MMALKVSVHDTTEELQKAVSSLIACKSFEAIKDHGFFTLGMSGGSVVKIISQGLLEQSGIEWDKWEILFCDERYVELTDPESNYNAVKKGFLENVPIKQENIISLNSNLDLENAARDYERRIKELYPNTDIPSLDYLVLGMGPDGHTCSLFPGHPLLKETKVLVASISDSPKPPPQRITLTYPIINAAKVCMFVSTGEGKAEAVKSVLEGNAEDPLPAARVKPVNGELYWFLDKCAASLLKSVI